MQQYLTKITDLAQHLPDTVEPNKPPIGQVQKNSSDISSAPATNKESLLGSAGSALAGWAVQSLLKADFPTAGQIENEDVKPGVLNTADSARRPSSVPPTSAQNVSKGMKLQKGDRIWNGIEAERQKGLNTTTVNNQKQNESYMNVETKLASKFDRSVKVSSSAPVVAPVASATSKNETDLLGGLGEWDDAWDDEPAEGVKQGNGWGLDTELDL